MPPLSHPFRASPGSGNAQQSYDSGRSIPESNTNSSNLSSSNEGLSKDDSYYSPEEVEKRAQRKLKFIGGGIAVVLLYSILSTGLGDLAELFGGMSDEERRARRELALLEADDELPSRGPDRELAALREERSRAANKIGLLDSIFCSGRRQSSFCK